MAEPTPAPGTETREELSMFWRLHADLLDSLRRGRLFDHHDEPLDAAGKRIIRVIESRMRALAALPVAAPPAVTPPLADAAKMLALLGNPCPKNAQGDDHDWHECPRCEMLHELEMRGSLARRLMLAAAAALGGPNG